MKTVRTTYKISLFVVVIRMPDLPLSNPLQDEFRPTPPKVATKPANAAGQAGTEKKSKRGGGRW